jgi:hypothetical protein
MKLSYCELEALLASSEHSMFPAFWRGLMEACRSSGMAPARLLSSPITGLVPRLAMADVERLRAVECPFDLATSPWGPQAMLAGFRRLAARAGFAGAEKLEFDVLYL